MNYVFHVLITINIYILLSISLNLMMGYTGMIALSHAAFFGIGAYASALLSLHFGWNFLLSMIAGVVIAGLLGVAVAIPSLRLKGDYFFLATFGFQIIIHDIFYNWSGLTKGPLGLAGIPRPSLFGFSIRSYASYFLLSLVFVLLCLLVMQRLVNSPFGRTLKSIREDEVVASTLGKDVKRFKIKVFAVSSAFCAVAGALYAHYVTFIDPFSFSFEESILILSLVIIGGAGSLRGPILGAFVLISLPEVMRYLQMPHSFAFQFRQMMYGLVLIVFMLFRPRGLIGEYEMD